MRDYDNAFIRQGVPLAEQAISDYITASFQMRLDVRAGLISAEARQQQLKRLFDAAWPDEASARRPVEEGGFDAAYVSKAERTSAAVYLRGQLSSGRITKDQYEQALISFDDEISGS